MFTKNHFRKFSGLVVLFLLLVGVSLSVNAQEISFTETFDDPALPGWDHTPNVGVTEGVLRIEAGGFAFHPGDWIDLVLSVSIRRFGEREIIVQFQGGEGHAYLVVVGSTFILIQREAGGEMVELASVHEIEIPTGEWMQLTIRSVGGEILVMLNDQGMVDAVDADPLPAGGVGFEVLSETTGEFDDLVVSAVGEASAEPEDQDQSSADQIPAAETLAWVRTGGPLGGLGYDVRMMPDDPDHLYVTDAFAGVFISEDGGLTWFPSNQGIESVGGMTGDAIPIFCLTIDPTDPQIIWVGTQGVRGIYRSEDGGQTWERRDSGVLEYEGITFRGITVDPTDNNVVYAAAELSSWVWHGQEWTGREFDMTAGVVYKTTDGGMNWQAVWRGDNLARYIWIDPRDTDVVYVSTGIFDREAANSDPANGIPGGEGVLKSTDGGRTWQNINNGLGNLYVGTLFMHPENPDILLAGAGNIQYYQGAGVYITIDGGQSWQRTLVEGGTTAVEFSLSDPQIAYAGDSNAIYRSQDGGWNWEQVDGEDQGWGAPGVLAGFPIDFQVDPRNPERLFANNYGGGNFLSEDGGATWVVASTGYTGAQVRAIAVDPANPARVFAAARSGIFVSEDAGITWQGLNYQPARVLEWNAVAVSQVDSDYILAANNWMGSILVSDDGGLSWQEGSGTFFGNGLAWRSFAISLSDPQVVYAGAAAFSTGGVFDDRLDSYGIYVSKDGGINWDEANDSSTQSAQITSLAVHPLDPMIVYAASPVYGLFKTDDGGESWESLHTGLPGSIEPFSVAVSPHEPETVFVGLNRGGLYRSLDGGQSWSQVGFGMNPESQISSIVFDPINSAVIFAADRSAGVFLSVDGGDTWQDINTGLGAKSVNALTISSDGLHVYAATEGGGVYRLDLNGQAPPVVDNGEVEAEPPQDPGQTAGEQGEVVSEPEEEGLVEGFPIALIFGGLTAVVVIIGAAIFILERRKR